MSREACRKAVERYDERRYRIQDIINNNFAGLIFFFSFLSG